VDIPISKGSEAPSAERAARASQRKPWLSNLLNSPVLLVVLSLAIVGLAFKWHAIQKSSDAPILPGWNWSSHPVDVGLGCYPLSIKLNPGGWMS